MQHETRKAKRYLAGMVLGRRWEREEELIIDEFEKKRHSSLSVHKFGQSLMDVDTLKITSRASATCFNLD